MKTDFRNRSRGLQDLRVVTLPDPGEDETRVDAVAGPGNSAKNVSENWILRKSRPRPY